MQNAIQLTAFLTSISVTKAVISKQEKTRINMINRFKAMWQTTTLPLDEVMNGCVCILCHSIKHSILNNHLFDRTAHCTLVKYNQDLCPQLDLNQAIALPQGIEQILDEEHMKLMQQRVNFEQYQKLEFFARPLAEIAQGKP